MCNHEIAASLKSGQTGASHRFWPSLTPDRQNILLCLFPSPLRMLSRLKYISLPLRQNYGTLQMMSAVHYVWWRWGWIHALVPKVENLQTLFSSTPGPPQLAGSSSHLGLMPTGSLVNQKSRRLSLPSRLLVQLTAEKDKLYIWYLHSKFSKRHQHHKIKFRVWN